MSFSSSTNIQFTTWEQFLQSKASIAPKGFQIILHWQTTCSPENFQLFISFSSSNTQFYKSWIFCLFTFWVFFPNKSFRLISKYNQKCQYNTLNWGNWNSGFVKLGVWWAEQDPIFLLFSKKHSFPHFCLRSKQHQKKCIIWKEFWCHLTILNEIHEESLL